MLFLVLLLLDIDTACKPKLMAFMGSQFVVCEGELDFESYGIGAVEIEPGDFPKEELEKQLLDSFTKDDSLGMGTKTTLRLQLTKFSKGHKNFGVTAHARGKWELREGDIVLANGWWLCSAPPKEHREKRLTWVWENLGSYFVEQFVGPKEEPKAATSETIARTTPKRDVGPDVTSFELKGMKLGMSLAKVKEIYPIAKLKPLEKAKGSITILDNQAEVVPLNDVSEARYQLSESESLELWFYGDDPQLIRIHYVREFTDKLDTSKIIEKAVANYGEPSAVDRINGGYPSEDRRATWAKDMAATQGMNPNPRLRWELPTLVVTAMHKRAKQMPLAGPGKILGTQLVMTLTSEMLTQAVVEAKRDHKEKREKEKKDMVDSITF